MRGLVDGETKSAPTFGACVARHDHFLSASRGMRYRDISEVFVSHMQVVYLPDDRDAKLRRGREGVCGYRVKFMSSNVQCNVSHRLQR